MFPDSLAKATVPRKRIVSHAQPTATRHARLFKSCATEPHIYAHYSCNLVHISQGTVRGGGGCGVVHGGCVARRAPKRNTFSRVFD